MLKIDLHSHTHFSDGKLSVPELLMRAEQMQVDYLAITDHDCVDAIAPALDFVKQQKKPKVSIVSGTEISTRWHGFEIHILGLDLDHTDIRLKERLASQIEKRSERALKIAAKLAKIGINNVYEDAIKHVVSHEGNKACISRAHIAQVLVERELCANFQQAFTRYLGAKKKAYVVPDWIDIPNAIKWIHEAGGKAVIAHPFHYDMTTKWLRKLANEFAQAGGDAMEVQHPNLAKAKHELMVDIAIEANLLGSSGSDFHGPSRWTELGRRLHIPANLQPIWECFERNPINQEKTPQES